MLISAYLITLLVPIQVSSTNYEESVINYHWVGAAVIDLARLVGFPTYRNKVAIENLNPELSLREPIKEDKPPPRRRQFVESYINHKNLTSTK